MFPCELLLEGADQQRDVAAMIAERGHCERDHVEPEIKVLPECPGRHHGVQVAVGRGDQAHVRPHRTVPAHPLKGPLAQHAEDLHLNGGVDLPDFI